MSNMLRLTLPIGKQKIELSIEERAQLNTIIDLLIPSDHEFPPPSSLHLVDELLRHLKPKHECKGALMLNERQLHRTLAELNALAGGSFCQISSDKQQRLLKHLEYHNPAFFQSLWTLVNHSYYSLLAHRQPAQLRRSV